tara:strand:+ start:176 stop:1531 length:1356 start_codon:yes stop_codon:yes gene_type:complete
MASRYLELTPSNKTTDDKYSFKEGVAQLNWTIPEGNFVLDPHSVRICGDVRFFKSNADPPVAPDNADALSLNQRIGVYSLFNSLIWRSSKHQTTISHERNWNRWLSSYLGISAGFEDSATHLSQTALTCPNYELQKRGTVVGTEIKSFCVHLPCGLLNAGQSIPLTNNTLGGLDLTVMLESDAMALQVLPGDFTTDPDIANYVGAHYELSNIKLICSIITPPPDQLSRLLSTKQGAMSYQSIHSYYDTANSNNMQVSMNFGLSKAKSLFINMIPSDRLNNLGADSLATLGPVNLDGSLADIQKIATLRGGTIYPKLFPRDTNFKETTDTMAVDPVIFKDYINSISDIHSNRRLIGGIVNANRGYLGKVAVVGGADKNHGTPYQFVNNGGVFYGIGVNYENFIGGSGINLNQEAWGLNVSCNLTSSNAQSLFIFVNAESTILWTPSGVQLMQ